MSYYMGDFYRGDFYRGDPGFWSSVLGIGRSLLGVGGGAKQMGQIIHVGSPAAAGVAGRAGEVLAKVGRGAGRMVRGHPVLSAAGAAGVIGAAGAAGARALAGRGGGRRRGRMQVTNTRALRRALRRIGGFAHVARKVLHYTQRCKHGKTLRFKFPKRKRA